MSKSRPRPQRILVIEHHAGVRSALDYLLNQQEEMITVGEADNVADLISHLQLTNADFILLDWELLDVALAQDLVTAVKAQSNPPKIIAMSMNAADEAFILSIGIDGFVHKRAPPNLLATMQLLNSASAPEE